MDVVDKIICVPKNITNEIIFLIIIIVPLHQLKQLKIIQDMKQKKSLVLILSFSLLLLFSCDFINSKKQSDVNLKIQSEEQKFEPIGSVTARSYVPRYVYDTYEINNTKDLHLEKKGDEVCANINGARYHISFSDYRIKVRDSRDPLSFGEGDAYHHYNASCVIDRITYYFDY